MDDKLASTSETLDEGPTCAIDGTCCSGPSEDGLIGAGCTLPPSKMPEQIARWQALFARMIGYEHKQVKAIFRFRTTPGMEVELQDLVKLEQVCCAHVSWDLEFRGHEAHLTLTADEGTLAALVQGFTDDLGGSA